MSWLVYRLTGSAFLLGVVGFTSQIPTFLLAPVAGVLADRWNRRRLLIVTQSFAMLQAALLAAAVLSGIVQVWHIVVICILMVPLFLAANYFIVKKMAAQRRSQDDRIERAVSDSVAASYAVKGLNRTSWPRAWA